MNETAEATNVRKRELSETQTIAHAEQVMRGYRMSAPWDRTAFIAIEWLAQHNSPPTIEWLGDSWAVQCPLPNEQIMYSTDERLVVALAVAVTQVAIEQGIERDAYNAFHREFPEHDEKWLGQ